MTLPDPPSLTPEERELAQRLARVGPHGEPSPALDARILAAAHAASTQTPASLPRRWPVALGLAASLVLAVGLAWRLRPLPEPPAYRSEPVSAVRMVSPTAQAPAAESAADSATQSAPTDADAMESSVATAPQVTDGVSETPARDETRKLAATPSPDEPAVALDDTAAQAASAKATELPASPPAPASPPVADAPQAFGKTASGATPAANDTAAASDQRRAAAAEANQASPIQAATTQDATAASTSRGDEPLDDIPPATADSPAVRDAWLQRIRALVGDGDIAGARASLHAFVRRYPAYPLPDDLHALAR